MIQHILVAVDGSDASRRAARFAQELARQTQARITLLFVLETPRMLPLAFLDSELITPPARTPEEINAVQRVLDEMAEGLSPPQVTKAVEIGAPADTILAMADSVGADHIVVGARGLSRGGKWLLGSVSDRVVHHAQRPVTVVH